MQIITYESNKILHQHNQNEEKISTNHIDAIVLKK